MAWYVKGLPYAAPFKERGQKIEHGDELEALAADYLAELEARGLADLPGGLAPRMAAAPDAPRSAGAGAGDDEDPFLADDGAAESASLAAQES